LNREKIYVIGALKNPAVPQLASTLRTAGHAVFADWYSPGPEADQFWTAYERSQGRTYRDALYGAHAANAFGLDRRHLDEATAGVLVLPAGKSGHLELGYLAGQGKRTFILFEGEPERWDLMYLFAEYVCFSVDELIEALATGAPRVTLPGFR
jgi:hypothetical protein